MNRIEFNDQASYPTKPLSPDMATNIIKTISVMVIMAALSACADNNSDGLNGNEDTQSIQSNYPDIIVGIDNETSINYMTLGLFNAKRNYVFTVRSKDNPEETFVYKTDISDLGFDKFEYYFISPASGFTLSATTDDIPPAEVIITNECNGDFSKCIRGWSSYP